MATSVLVTKLFIPPTRAELVPRPGLIERLNDGLERKLTLLSAPAGFGKTTLVSHWVESLKNNHGIGVQPIKVAWLTLNQDDNDPVRFLIYLITALNQIKDIKTNLGQGALSMLTSPQPPSTNTVLISLINDLAVIRTKIIFVLDDFHLIDAESIDQALVFLIENLPPQLHLVIATRQDPSLSLGRLRARDQLTEIRAADLRFNSSEAADFLNRVMGLDLSPIDITELESRTEGWIAGLQLAAISILGRKDKTDFIKSFTGSHRLVLDFLIEEVLGQQPESIQNFLLHTSILDRMTGALCDTLISEENSQEILENLDRANLFIIPLDEERLWYRYHQLFADLLRQRMHQTQAEQVKALHHKASEWYETNGYIDEAIEHSLLAEDYDRAAKQIEATAETMWGSGYDKLRHWLFLLPDELICFTPKLCIYKAWYLLSSGHLDAADQVLNSIDPMLDSSIDRENGTTTQEQDQVYASDDKNLRGMLAATRAFAAFYRVEIENLIVQANRALEYLPVENITWRITAYNALGDGYDFKGEILKSYHARLEALEVTRIAGSIYPAMVASAKLAINLRLQGQLQEVQEVCRQQLQFAVENGMTQSDVAGWSLAIWSETMAELDDLEGAIQRAETGVRLAEGGRDLAILGWSYICLLRVLFSSGDITGVEEIIQKIENISLESYGPPWILNYQNAWQARTWLIQGDLEAASQWVNAQGMHTQQDVGFLREMEYLVLVRILIAQGELIGLSTFLQRLFDAADQAGGRISSKIEIMLLQALVFQAQGDVNQAIAILTKAIEMAEPLGFIRIFIDEGPPMASLLYEALKREIAPEYMQRLLAAYPVTEQEESAPPNPQVDPYGLIEPLSDREIEVLHLIALGLTNQDIATRLFLSLHTVKAHTRNIYSKLAVHNRTEAVARARALGILPVN